MPNSILIMNIFQKRSSKNSKSLEKELYYGVYKINIK